MSKRRANIPWSRLRGAAPVAETTSESEFEQVAARLNLTPDEYVNSPNLRAWAEKTWRMKFVPEKLLKAWHLSDWGPPDD
jgi:hypothetical protein